MSRPAARTALYAVCGLMLYVLGAIFVGPVFSTNTWRTIMLVSVAVGQTAFVALYLTFPWWEKFLGRSLFFKAVALALIVDMFVVYRIFDLPHGDEVFVILYSLLAVGVWGQFFAFLNVRLHKRQRAVSGNFRGEPGE